ncbi:glutamate--cysteine ligase [Rothia sp. ND6WE1A]|uniref:glutamate--cysteine ligase n=1 Tax=Rothia sp. ND6WE1A TaxID=1848190 RepID=UPI000831D46D|nr:glutamate--cysteine ligase [Rothia sp. ND6WE1A]
MISFAKSAQSTLGVEWELALVDSKSMELTSRAQEVFDLIEELSPELLDASTGPHITGEFLDNTVELVTGVSANVAEAVHQLEKAKEQLMVATDQLGIEIFSAGTHPFSRSIDQPIANKDRYQKMLDRTQYWGRQMMIYGVHVHTGIDSKAKALPVLNGLSNFYPHLLALSASSPFWEGFDTGYASQRALMFQQLPTAGLPFSFESWEDYEVFLKDLMVTGVIDDPSENRWDIRPVAHYGTVEMRVCDGLSSLNDISGLVAFDQCLVESLSRDYEAGKILAPLKPWHMQENKWRAARYGLDAIIIQDNDNNELLVTEDIERLLNIFEPIARDLDCSDDLAQVERMIQDGGSATQQRKIAQESGNDLTAVVRYLVEQTKSPYFRSER